MRQGFELESLLSHWKISKETLGNPDGRIPRASLFQTWSELHAMTGDPVCGIHAAEALPPGTFEILDLALESCATAGDVLEKLARYLRIIDPKMRLDVLRSAGGISVRHVFVGHETVPPLLIEFTLASFVARARDSTRTRVTPIRVAFKHDAPDDLSEYRRFFGAPVLFGQTEDEVLLDPSIVDLPIVGHNPVLALTLETQMETLLRTLVVRSEDALLPEARRVVALLLRGGKEPDLCELARYLNVGPRTLQRRLREVGSSPRLLVADVRREVATACLADRMHSIDEIAYLIGFAHPSAFRRAFKQWTGKTPRRFREGLSSAEVSRRLPRVNAFSRHRVS